VLRRNSLDAVAECKSCCALVKGGHSSAGWITGRRDTAEGENPGPKIWIPVRSPPPKHNNLLFYYPVACHASAPNMAKACVTSVSFFSSTHARLDCYNTLPCRLQIGTALLDLIIIDISSNNYQCREIIPPSRQQMFQRPAKPSAPRIPCRNGPSQSPTRFAKSER
jgi:hypothetical protein